MIHINGKARLGRSPELKFVGEGKEKKPVCELWVKMLNNRKVKSSEDWEDLGFWAQVNVWGSLAESAARFLTKGDRIYVIGSMVNKSWTSSESESDDEEQRNTMVIDSNFVAPYLADVELLKYKPRKTRSAGESGDDKDEVAA